MASKIDSQCPCCKQPVTVEHKPAKWQGEEDKVIIVHKKWQPSWKTQYLKNMSLRRA